MKMILARIRHFVFREKEVFPLVTELLKFLTNFMPLVSFYAPWKQKNKVFLMFSGGIEKDQWYEMG